MKGMKGRQQKGKEEEGEQKQEEETKEHLALVAKSKSDNRMAKLSAYGMLSWWVCSSSLFVFAAQRKRFSKEIYYRGHLACTG